MNDTPDVQPLPYTHRVWFFRILLVVFVLSVPVFTFYATGYRFSFSGEEGNIVSVGGIFISVEADNTTTYLNDKVVDDFRVFQQAAYIQNLPAGTHRLHVQGEGLHTWVKELAVYPHIVTEAEAFNLPVVPQIRLVTEYQTATGTAVVFGPSTTEPFASGTVAYRAPWQVATSAATSSYTPNPEFVFVESLFASSTAPTSTLLSRFSATDEQFTFSSTPKPVATTTATTTVTMRDRVLYERDGELFVTWTGSESSIPYYFCYQAPIATSTLPREDALSTELERQCMETVQISRWNQDVYFYTFFPENDDLVLLHRSDGIHVAEVDNRGWQNEQKIYPAGDYQLILSGAQIFIADSGYYFELLTELDE